MLSSLTLDSELVGNLLQAAIKRVPMEEALDVEQVWEEQFQNLVKLVTV